jgi:hypothetical protein
MAEKLFVTREVFAKSRKAIRAAKCCKAPLSVSLTGQFLLQDAVCSFANWLRCQHKLSQGAGVHLRDQCIRNHIY